VTDHGRLLGETAACLPTDHDHPLALSFPRVAHDRSWGHLNIDRVRAKGRSTELPVRSGSASTSVADSVLFHGVSHLGLAARGYTKANVGWGNG